MVQMMSYQLMVQLVMSMKAILRKSHQTYQVVTLVDSWLGLMLQEN